MKTINSIIIIAIVIGLSACSNDKPAENTASTPAPKSMVKKDPAARDIGVGPITELKLPETIDDALAKTGGETFEAKCTACHKIGKRFVGPDLTDVVSRREPEWIMNMILDPEKMVKENEAAKALLAEYMSPMANQSLTQDEARSILEYFRTLK